MRETTHTATNEASGGSPHQKAGCRADYDNVILMSWAEWAATPRDYRLVGQGRHPSRWVMRMHPTGGVALYPVHITG